MMQPGVYVNVMFSRMHYKNHPIAHCYTLHSSCMYCFEKVALELVFSLSRTACSDVVQLKCLAPLPGHIHFIKLFDGKTQDDGRVEAGCQGLNQPAWLLPDSPSPLLTAFPVLSLFLPLSLSCFSLSLLSRSFFFHSLSFSLSRPH